MSAGAEIPTGTPETVLPGLPRGEVGIAVSTGVAGKSFLLLEAALAVATGQDIGGLWQVPITAGPTYYICGTDPRGIVRARLENVLAHAEGRGGHPPRDFHVLLDDSHEITLFERGRDPVAAHPMLTGIERLVTAQGARLVVFEHLERYLNRAGLAWSDPATRAGVLRILRASARRMDCAILIAPRPWAEYPEADRPDAEVAWDLWLAQDSPDDPLTLRYSDRRANAPVVRALVRGADGVLTAIRGPDER